MQDKQFGGWIGLINKDDRANGGSWSGNRPLDQGPYVDEESTLPSYA
tara:strand:- start:2145 stop:2285 length:141 start_codon:yes stop_codon:yes gene_type:complete